MNNKGFTLIELLVVIAIIGILSGIVLTSLSGARTKAKDAEVQSNMSGMRTAAELLYSNNTPNSYAGLCTAGATNPADPYLTALQGEGCSFNATTGAQAHQKYAVTAPLISDPTKSWCVDSSGKSGVGTGASGVCTITP